MSSIDVLMNAIVSSRNVLGIDGICVMDDFNNLRNEVFSGATFYQA